MYYYHGDECTILIHDGRAKKETPSRFWEGVVGEG